MAHGVAAQGIDGAASRLLVDGARPDSGEEPLRWLALPVVLAIGWGTFFGLSAVFLADDAPSRPAAAHGAEIGLTESQAAIPALVMIGEPRKAQPSWRDVDPLRSPRNEAAPADSAPAVASGPADPVVAKAPVAASPPQAPPAPAGAERADFVGVWGPTAAACQAPSRRRGYIPATITLGGAKAGRTVCSFKDRSRAGAGWIMAASCSERGRRWSSQVRLVVDGNRLTWSSGKGDAAYVRCARREG